MPAAPRSPRGDGRRSAPRKICQPADKPRLISPGPKSPPVPQKRTAKGSAQIALPSRTRGPNLAAPSGNCSPSQKKSKKSGERSFNPTLSPRGAQGGKRR
ncbi:unnamed protein product [Coccothraustes coccothraustes]